MSHSMKNLAFHSLFGWKKTILKFSLPHFSNLWSEGLTFILQVQHVGVACNMLWAFGHQVAQCCVRLANPVRHVATWSNNVVCNMLHLFGLGFIYTNTCEWCPGLTVVLYCVSSQATNQIVHTYPGVRHIEVGLDWLHQVRLQQYNPLVEHHAKARHRAQRP